MFTIFIGIMIVVLLGLFMWAMILSCVCICAKYSCCKRNIYYVNKKEPESIRMNDLPELESGSRTDTEQRSRIDIEQKKKEERHPGLNRKKVMIVDDDGNLPPYTLRSRSVDGNNDRYTTYMNVNVRKGAHKETEL